jgi:hypothetical protein
VASTSAKAAESAAALRFIHGWNVLIFFACPAPKGPLFPTKRKREIVTNSDVARQKQCFRALVGYLATP